MSTIAISIAPAADAIPREAWTRLCPPEHPFLNADFLAIIERHGAAGKAWGWAACHLVASDEKGSVVGLLPLYIKQHSHGDFIHDWSWADAYRQLGRDYYPKLMTGIPHTPAAGPRLLVADGPLAGRIAQALVEAAKALTAEGGASSWHIAFPLEKEAALLHGAGLLTSHNVQFQWLDEGYGDFDGYLATFSAEKRRKVRAERRRAAESGLQLEVRSGNEIAAGEWPALHALYAATFEKFNNHAVFSASCLAELAATLGARMVVFLARERGDPVALSLCFRSNEVLYGRYWGCRGDYPSLHFELCFYQGISYCLREGLRRFEPGAGGEHKIARGFIPTIVKSQHWIADPTMRQLIGRHLERQGGAMQEYRDDAAEHLPFRREG